MHLTDHRLLVVTSGHQPLLVGMGCGKSTVGPLLAKALGYRSRCRWVIRSRRLPSLRSLPTTRRGLPPPGGAVAAATQPMAFAGGGHRWRHRHRAGELGRSTPRRVIWLDVAEDELLRRLQADRRAAAGWRRSSRPIHCEQRQPSTGGGSARGAKERTPDLEGYLDCKAPDAPQTTAPRGAQFPAQAVSSSHSTCWGRPSTAAMSAGNCFSRCSCSANQWRVSQRWLFAHGWIQHRSRIRGWGINMATTCWAASWRCCCHQRGCRP